MKAKKLREALEQLAEEGVVQLFIPVDGSAAIVGVVGALQLDVLADRLANEYGVPVEFRSRRAMRSCAGYRAMTPRNSMSSSPPTGFPSPMTLTAIRCFMAQSAFSLNYTLERAPEIKATEIKEMHKAS